MISLLPFFIIYLKGESHNFFATFLWYCLSEWERAKTITITIVESALTLWEAIQKKRHAMNQLNKIDNLTGYQKLFLILLHQVLFSNTYFLYVPSLSMISTSWAQWAMCLAVIISSLPNLHFFSATFWKKYYIENISLIPNSKKSNI